MTRKLLAVGGLLVMLAVAAWLWPNSNRTREGNSGGKATTSAQVEEQAVSESASPLAVAVSGSAQGPVVSAEVSASVLPHTAQPPALELVPLGVYATGIFDGGAAEIAGYDPASKRAFVVNASARGVDILDLSDPNAPQHLGVIDVARYGDSPTSLDVHDGLLAIAVKAADASERGRLIFANVEGTVLADVEVGVRPDMVTFTPDGSKALTADEGEPNQEYSEDPEGSVTIVDLSGGVESLAQDAVEIVDFRAYNSIDLDPAIRIYGPGATVAQDLEPESIAITPDSRSAYVTLQENNALAVIDIEKRLAVELIPLGYKDHSRPFVTGLRNYAFGDMPPVGRTSAGQEIRLGGLSGLWFEGVDEATGSLIFVTHPDRGPNAAALDLDGDGKDERPFALPEFNPSLVRFALDVSGGEITILEQIPLTLQNGRPLSGLSNVTQLPGAARADEPPIDLFGRPLPTDPLGADLESLVHAPDGSWWMGDEYRPSLLHFDAGGRLLARYVPEGSNRAGVELGVEALPAVIAQRQDNRGFEALALDGSILYAFLQSPVDNPASDGDVNAEASNLVRIVAFDTQGLKTVGEYLYVIEGGPVDKLGDAVALGNGEFLVLERDNISGPDARKFVFRISLEGATNLLEDEDRYQAGVDQGLELWSAGELQEAGIQPVRKSLFVDLTAAGYELVDKPEGMTLVGSDLLALVNDNDFGLTGAFDPATGALDDNPEPIPSLLTLLSLKPTSIDVSDRDGGIHFTTPAVLGMFQPDGIGVYAVGGANYLVTANEGDGRAYKGFSEEIRVKDQVLDPAYFANVEDVQRDENAGRLRTTSATGSAGNDADGDGRAERLLAYGTRSISIWDADGNLVWDSGDELERLTATLLPAHFNSGDANDSFDSRSDVSGPEPEGLALGTVDGRMYAFVGLERLGGVVVYDISDPVDAHFVTYATTRDFAGDPQAGTAGDISPEGVHFVDAADSPTGEPLLLVANELSGSTRVFAVRPPAQP